jgi:N-acetyl-1-D-myo-inositol-2-amino-2-deoxy-alpha-D-glucopyranoside deacetylase
MSMAARNKSGDAVLAVFAHPDDEVLCCAGTLALCAARGSVTLVCATRGEHGPIADASLATRENLAAVRENELRASCAALGVQDIRILGLPDSGVAWAGYDGATLNRLVAIVRELRPRALITFGPDGLYGHSDHVAIGELAMEARHAAADSRFSSDGSGRPSYRIPRAYFPVLSADFVASLLAELKQRGTRADMWSLQPSAFQVLESEITARVDVSSVLDRKQRAVHCHRTQLEADNAWGLVTGDLAERFWATEFFRCADGLSGDPLSD